MWGGGGEGWSGGCSFGRLCMSCVAFISLCVCASFHLVPVKGGLWDLIVLVPDHCLLFYFPYFYFMLSMAYRGFNCIG